MKKNHVKKLIALVIIFVVAVAAVGCSKTAEAEAEAETVTAQESSTEDSRKFAIESGFVNYYVDGDLYWQYEVGGVSQDAQIIVLNEMKPTIMIQDGKTIWYCNGIGQDSVSEKMTENGYPCRYFMEGGDGATYQGFVFLNGDGMYFQSVYPFKPGVDPVEPVLIATGVAEIISEDFFIGVDGNYYASTTFDRQITLPENGIAVICLGDSEIVGRDIQRVLDKQMSSKDFRDKYRL